MRYISSRCLLHVFSVDLSYEPFTGAEIREGENGSGSGV